MNTRNNTTILCIYGNSFVVYLQVNGQWAKKRALKSEPLGFQKR